jgi:hypothetical protein
MKLLSIIRARSIWLFPTQDVNPRGKNINVELIEWLKDRYSFLKYPSSLLDMGENQEVTFVGGSFHAHGIDISIDLGIYNDGLIADTRSSTKDSDAFMEDFLLSASKYFDLVYEPESIRKKLYVSEVHVRSERSLNRINPKMQAFVRKIISMIGADNAKSLETSSVGLWWDPAMPNQQSHFQFERAVNVPFSEKRYYSRAPLHTEDHLSLLDEFEDLLVGR